MTNRTHLVWSEPIEPLALAPLGPHLHVTQMTEITARLSTALADRYKIERHLGEGGMATV